MSHTRQMAKKDGPEKVKPAANTASVQPEAAPRPVRPGGRMTASQVLGMQRTAGNQSVQRALKVTQSTSEGTVQRHMTPAGQSALSGLPGQLGSIMGQLSVPMAMLQQAQAAVAVAMGNSSAAMAGSNPPMPQTPGGAGPQPGGSTSGGSQEIVVPAAGGI